MTNPLLFRIGRHTPRLSNFTNIVRCRLVSSASNKKSGANSVRESHSLPGLSPAQPTEWDISSTFGSSKHSSKYQPGFNLEENIINNPGYSAHKSIAKDPLQHIFDHPSASIILRDACRCIKCKDQGTSQREFNLAEIPSDLKPSSVEQDARGNWVVRWENDMPGWEDHISIYTPHQIERLTTYMQKDHRASTRLWKKDEYEREKFTLTYEEYMNTDIGLAKTLYHFGRHGVVFIQDVPKDENAVTRLAERIAPMKSTFYGPTWDIRSIPEAKNVAFTSKHLGFHGDLMYLKEPPTVQFLHCLQNSCAGGESRWVDQFKALDTLYTEDAELAEALTEIKLRYEYDNDGYYYSDIKPVVQWRTNSYAFPHRTIRGAANPRLHDVYRMYWAPQFLGSILSDFSDSDTKIKRSVAAMKKYAEILERDDMVYQTKLTEGTCVMFDNLRVLHARNEFDQNSGQRWLRGTYVDAQDLWSVEVKLKDHMLRLELETSRAD